MNGQLTQSIKITLAQIGAMLDALSNEQYGRSIPVLSGASLGGHVRHVIEFFTELDRGYRAGEVNYDARQRDKTIEQQRELAINSIHRIAHALDKENKILLLTTATGVNETGFQVNTNYERELVYNLEHAVHHMALMKIGVRELTTLQLPESFGVAISTIQYHKTPCAQ